MNFEQRLREAFQRPAGARPDEAGAYERFLHERRRHARVVAATTGVVLVVVLTLAVVGIQLLTGRREIVTRPGPVPASRVVSKPDRGFELPVPSGWRLTDDLGQILVLVPLRMDARGGASIEVGVFSLDTPQVREGPTGPVVRLSAGRVDSGPAIARVLDVSGPGVSYGTRPDGRGFVRAERATIGGRHHMTSAIAWPYHCAAGVACPNGIVPRALKLEAYGYDSDWRNVDATARQLVDTIRPIGNGVVAQPAGARPACQLDDDMAAPFYGSFQAKDGSVLIFAGVLRGVLPCQLRQRAAVTMTLAGKPAPVRSSGVPVALTGQLPEGGTDGTGTIVLTWRWANWCGSKQVRAQLIDPDRPGQQSLLTFFSPTPIHPPRCADRSKPSTFQVIHVDH